MNLLDLIHQQWSKGIDCFLKKVCPILCTPPRYGAEFLGSPLKNEWYKNSQ